MMNEAVYAEANRTYWTHRAPSYGDVNRKELATAQRRIWTQTLDVRIQARFPDRARSSIRVLDVGTGPGFFAVILNALGYAVTAVDYTDAMLNEARLNAGEAAEHIHFHCMDAEKLGFADASFDVVVSRNLTWNLPHPDRAYAEWARVLKPNGLLLNFDANWYRYLYDEEMRKGYEADRAATAAEQVRDEYVNTDIEAMEEIARNVPLSRELRPQWDEQILQQTGFGTIDIDTDIWQKLWTEDEKINYASTPMFRIAARRGISE